MPGRVLITGAGGFLGRHCLPRLLADGWDVHAVGRGGCPGLPAGIVTHTADLRHALAAVDLMERVRPTHLMHLAWITTPGICLESQENSAWSFASAALVDAFIAVGGRRAVFAGTCAEYDWDGPGLCHEFTTPLRPASMYGRHKRELFDHVELQAAIHGLSWGWGRIFFLYGPGEPATKLVSTIASALVRSEPASYSTGIQSRDFIHVADVVECFMALLKSEVQGPVNVGTGQAWAVREVAEELGRITGRSDLLRPGTRPLQAGEPPLLVADTTRVREALGWQARIPLREGLARAVEECRRNLIRAA